MSHNIVFLSHYNYIIGPPGSCKSEASKCGLSLFGAHELHACNNQTTPSYLFQTASKMTIPICVDDVTEKSADAWEELFIDAQGRIQGEG